MASQGVPTELECLFSGKNLREIAVDELLFALEVGKFGAKIRAETDKQLCFLPCEFVVFSFHFCPCE